MKTTQIQKFCHSPLCRDIVFYTLGFLVVFYVLSPIILLIFLGELHL